VRGASGVQPTALSRWGGGGVKSPVIRRPSWVKEDNLPWGGLVSHRGARLRVNRPGFDRSITAWGKRYLPQPTFWQREKGKKKGGKKNSRGKSVKRKTPGLAAKLKSRHGAGKAALRALTVPVPPECLSQEKGSHGKNIGGTKRLMFFGRTQPLDGWAKRGEACAFGKGFLIRRRKRLERKNRVQEKNPARKKSRGWEPPARNVRLLKTVTKTFDTTKSTQEKQFGEGEPPVSQITGAWPKKKEKNCRQTPKPDTQKCFSHQEDAQGQGARRKNV